MEMKKILVVDDEQVSREMAEFILKKGHYDVKSVRSGDAAISAIGLNDYDLILLDVEMPGKNGVETLREIRNGRDDVKDIKVVFLTSDSSMKTVQTAAALGAVGYIRKPFDPVALLERVGKILDSEE